MKLLSRETLSGTKWEIETITLELLGIINYNYLSLNFHKCKLDNSAENIVQEHLNVRY